MKQSEQSQRKHKSPVYPASEHPSIDIQTAHRYAAEWSGMTINLEGGNTNMFMGMQMAQEWPDLLIWEAFFNNYPIKTLVELGTGHGGMSLFFALQCYQRGIVFHTFDNIKSFRDCPIATLVDLNAKFHHVDIFTEAHDMIKDLLTNAPKPLAVFFDDGDKPREWRTFGPYTSPGDYLIVHDWGTEFDEGDTAGVSVVRILGDLSDVRPRGWKAMWFKRT